MNNKENKNNKKIETYLYLKKLNSILKDFKKDKTKDKTKNRSKS